MILELDTSLFKKFELTINQLVFISLVLNDNQKPHQDIHELLSRVSEEEIQDLIQRNIITVSKTDNETLYNISDNIAEIIKFNEDSLFDEFYNTFPVYVIRPDGTKGFLRSNINKCKREYNRIIKKSLAMHEYIIECLKFEIEDKMRTGKIGYMKTMWKWLTQHEWECYEEQMKLQQQESEEMYGTAVS